MYFFFDDVVWGRCSSKGQGRPVKVTMFMIFLDAPYASAKKEAPFVLDSESETHFIDLSFLSGPSASSPAHGSFGDTWPKGMGEFGIRLSLIHDMQVNSRHETAISAASGQNWVQARVCIGFITGKRAMLASSPTCLSVIQSHATDFVHNNRAPQSWTRRAPWANRRSSKRQLSMLRHKTRNSDPKAPST